MPGSARVRVQACRRSASLNVVENGEPAGWRGSLLPVTTSQAQPPTPRVIL